MSAAPDKIRVFVSSPGDVGAELERLDEVVKELNGEFTAREKVSVELRSWRTDAVPSAGRPQAVVTQWIGEYHIYVGVMWRRFGTPTGVAGSGTEEEFNLAYDSWT